ncbi:C40 family peptidase [Flavitalea flava]
MSRAICCVPVSPLRVEASHRKEMVTQLVFGEECELLDKAPDNWVKVQCSYDGYEGWCQASHLAPIGEEYERGGNILTPDWITVLEYNGHPMTVPMGSVLTAMKNGHAVWGKNQVWYKGKTWDASNGEKDAKSIRQLAFKFLNTPYLWGGKTVFGTDCSGFTQTIFKFLDTPLLRDACQQATQGEPVGFLEETKTGDLAFFDNADGKITHVGLLLNTQEIIHASGKVRIDKIDNQGILNTDTLERTHHLRIIRRILT